MFGPLIVKRSYPEETGIVWCWCFVISSCKVHILSQTFSPDSIGRQKGRYETNDKTIKGTSRKQVWTRGFRDSWKPGDIHILSFTKSPGLWNMAITISTTVDIITITHCIFYEIIVVCYCVYRYISMSMSMSTHTHAHTRTHAHTHTHIYIYIYIYIYIGMSFSVRGHRWPPRPPVAPSKNRGPSKNGGLFKYRRTTLVQRNWRCLCQIWYEVFKHLFYFYFISYLTKTPSISLHQSCTSIF